MYPSHFSEKNLNFGSCSENKKRIRGDICAQLGFNLLAAPQFGSGRSWLLISSYR